MSNILLITSSPRGPESLSSRFADQLVQALLASKGGQVVKHDLGQSPIPHLDAVTTSAIRKPAEARSPEEAAAAKTSDGLVSELLACDTLVLATGMINFGICSSLKSWIDNVVRAGMTFRYTETGPIGLATGQKTYLVLSSGGVYSDGPSAAMDHAVPYLKTVLGFIGLTDVEVILIEGLAYGPDAAERAMAEAQTKISKLALAA